MEILPKTHKLQQKYYSLDSLTHPYGATLQDGDLQRAHVHVHSLHVGDFRIVVAVLVVDVDLVVGHGGEVAGLGHHVAAVAHEVVLATVKGGVVWVSRGYAGGRSCVEDGGGRNEFDMLSYLYFFITGTRYRVDY